MLSLRRLIAPLRRERGFTLVETLVAMLTGIIVTGALFAILEFSVRQTSRLSQTAQATEVSRTAMTHIVDQLHSACLSLGFSPVQKGSSENKLVFWNGYSEEAEVPSTYTSKGGSTKAKSEGVRLDTVEWNEKTGYLLDHYQLGEGTESSGEYKPSSTVSTVRLAEHVGQIPEVVNAKGEVEKTIPIFRYYDYASTSATGTSEAAATLTPVELAKGKELTEAEAEKVASVQVNFRTSPGDKEVRLSTAEESTTPADLSTQTTFAFSAPNSEAKVTAGPCE